MATGVDTGGTTGDRIVAVAHDAFLSGYHLAVLVAAGITLIAAVGVFRWLPARATAPERAVVPVGPDGDDDMVGSGPRDGDGPTPAVEGAVG